MLSAVLRSIGAVIVGLGAAMAMIVGVEFFSSIVHPFPPGIDPSDIEACKAHVARYPSWVLAVVVVAWGATVFAGSWLATRLGTRRHVAHGLLVGAILLLLVIFNMAMLPYPRWFEAANVLVFPLGALLAVRFAR